MEPFILETRGLIRDYSEYAPFFAFYEMGLKDVVREAVLSRSFNSPYSTSSYNGQMLARGLVTKVVEDFEYAFDNYHDCNYGVVTRDIFNQERLRPNLSVIRFVAAEIEQAAHAMLHHHLRTRLFEIAQEDARPIHQPRWVGDDLLVFIRALRGREA